ncbi:ABC transporter substrate-binding protein [Bradyrhizobium sp. G127]|uniref:ABC transporter substrate-binding protein n=1 Tax=Bradyrhizobium sp. G127 TaxID=2904800 RepID=UPI001F277687|nr:ABC transporter substrate-binding protein [Bradyrhizobium sp. G127]MCF2524732.1 ABC transporter substrate-binding protein [Bradyrhizobium sp. G127]
MFEIKKTCVAAIAMAAVSFSPMAVAQETVKLGQIEALTGATATYGWMSAQGTKVAVEEINAKGGFKVGDKTYKIQLLQMDTRGEPREATVQFRKMMEENVQFVFGPFLTNVFNAIEPIANQNNGKFLLFAGATSAHHALGKPDHDYLLRTWNWDAGQSGFGKLMVDYLKKLNTKKVAMLFQNDAFGKTAVDIYTGLFKDAGIELQVELFEPGTKDFSAALAKLASGKPDILFPGYSDAVLYDIVRQSTESGFGNRFFLVRGSIGPALKNKDTIADYIAYVPKYFEEAEKTEPKTKAFVESYKKIHKRDFPYDQAPLCSSSCYDHVYMLVEAMQKAGTVSDVAKIRKVLSEMTYDGLWKIKYDQTGEAVFGFDVVHVRKGGTIEVVKFDPTK